MIKKISIFSVLFLILGGSIFYFSATKLQKNKIKHFVYHNLGILESDWNINIKKKENEYIANFDSPTLLIDDVYSSMEGPYTYKKTMLNKNEDALYWIHQFEAKANSTNNKKGNSNDFICHVNLYHSTVEHFSRMGFQDRIGAQKESQLITLTTGGLNVKFPKGFGYPVYSNEKILLGSQALNLNDKNDWFNVNYNFKIHYSKENPKTIKPLYMKYLVLTLPYKDEAKPQFKTSIDNLPEYVVCAGANSNSRHESVNEKGENITAFWKVPVGKHIYSSDVTNLLALNKEETMHYINVHVHPYATNLALVDATTNTVIFESIITNAQHKKGIKNITSFSSEEGVVLYPDHKYKMKLTVNNTTKEEIDMMGSFFVYFYDKEFDEKLKSEI
ncbi:hypothetical protein [Polaribacter cellanae]|uniref:Uncharacterized protein n=1 Tax=Polaribacter cellanae TaxID=2818493 RepID=A0A975CPQ0_9FLAO|nr:hypothetical protein [Polaribacter cellanae]QTE23403.1 hypothetical protein J3359_03750 [Polaribacter cellanae]